MKRMKFSTRVLFFFFPDLLGLIAELYRQVDVAEARNKVFNQSLTDLNHANNVHRLNISQLERKVLRMEEADKAKYRPRLLEGDPLFMESKNGRAS